MLQPLSHAPCTSGWAPPSPSFAFLLLSKAVEEALCRWTLHRRVGSSMQAVFRKPPIAAAPRGNFRSFDSCSLPANVDRTIPGIRGLRGERIGTTSYRFENLYGICTYGDVFKTPQYFKTEIVAMFEAKQSISNVEMRYRHMKNLNSFKFKFESLRLSI